MLRKRYYILFVARDEDGRVRKIPVPLRYAYGFVAASIVGAFTIVGMAGSYTRMLLKTENYNQVRQERESLRKDYKQMVQIAHERDVQVASLGALASEVSALYGLRQNRLAAVRHSAAAAAAASGPAPASTTLALSNTVSPQTVSGSIDQLAALRDDALSGRISLALQDGLSPSFTGNWTTLADAPSLWPVEGEVTSSFGERIDPIRGEGEFHTGIDIAAPYGSPVRAAAAGLVTGADMGHGYGRTVELNNGHDIMTVYAHLSGVAVVPGQHVSRGQVIGYLGESGRTTGPNLHYEVRVDGIPVNPYKYLRDTYTQFARLDTEKSPAGQ
jgi:murein DD-endopeptidase MepM/ murein hydrolase activator NlpD